MAYYTYYVLLPYFGQYVYIIRSRRFIRSSTYTKMMLSECLFFSVPSTPYPPGRRHRLQIDTMKVREKTERKDAEARQGEELRAVQDLWRRSLLGSSEGTFQGSRPFATDPSNYLQRGEEEPQVLNFKNFDNFDIIEFIKMASARAASCKLTMGESPPATGLGKWH